MRNRVEVLGQVGIDHIRVASPEQVLDLLDRVSRRPVGPIAVGIGLEVRFEDRLDHKLDGSLHHAIPDGRDAERSLTAAGLRDQNPPHRLWSIGLGPQFLTQTGQPFRQARRLDLLERHPIHTRSAVVVTSERVGVGENVLAPDLVVELIETELRLRLRLDIELPLQRRIFSGFIRLIANIPLLDCFESVPEMRVLPSTGITRSRR
jgi:hypothetical protein